MALPAFVIPLLWNMGVSAALSALVASVTGGGNPEEIARLRQETADELIANGISPEMASRVAEEAGAEPTHGGDIAAAAGMGAVTGGIGYGAFKGVGSAAGKIGSFLGRGAKAGAGAVGKSDPFAVRTMGRMPKETPNTGFSVGDVNPIRGRVPKDMRMGDPTPVKEAIPVYEPPARFTDVGQSIARGGEGLPAPGAMKAGYSPSVTRQAEGVQAGMPMAARGNYANAQAEAAQQKMREMAAMQELRRRQTEGIDRDAILAALESM